MKRLRETLLVIGALGGLITSSSAGLAATLINGAGATFPYPLYSKWFSEYQKSHPDVQINYQSIGSGGGIRQLIDNTIDFGASDAPMTEEQLSKAKSPIVHIPTVLGAVVPIYNLPGVGKGLKLTPELLADIFLGKVKNWNDERLVKLNPDIKLPSDPVLVARRSDGSGTTGILTDYLSKVSPEWKSKVGSGNAVRWPVGLGGKGNEGVAGLVKLTPGMIGYSELGFAINNKLAHAAIKNKAGQFILADVNSVTAAAAGAVKTMPADFRVSITNADGKGSYPISGFTYLLVYKKISDDPEKGAKIKKFLKWALNEGQEMAAPLHYAPLPNILVNKVDAKLKELK